MIPFSTRPATSLLALAFAGGLACSDEPAATPAARSGSMPDSMSTSMSPSESNSMPAATQPSPGTLPAAGSPSASEGAASDAPLAPAPAGPPTAGAPSSADAGAPDPGDVADGPRPLDLLFVVDNSISMAGKQALLSQVANVIERFAHPLCVDAAGNQLPAPVAGAECAAGQRRQFEPVTDVHLGVISTSLGDVGANVACPQVGFPRFVEDRVDNAHLIGSLPRGSGAGANATGFVSWRAGEDEAAASASLAALISAAGENGCGWEMPLEASYRFLADPFPPQQLVRVECPGTTGGATNCVQPATDTNNRIVLDDALLTQRAAFLRPNSRLGVVMLTDENDCSVTAGNQSWVVLAIDDARPMLRGSSACDQNPNDPCCFNCALGAPEGCTADPVCAADPATGALENRLPVEADGLNLRCFHQKERFGVDFLYPVARYVNALTQPTLCWSAPDLSVEGCLASDVVPNPLFEGGRAPSDVFLGGILGVPASLIAAQQDTPGRPPVASGFRYKLASELTAQDWSAMVGDGSASPPAPPTSPFMIESPLAREGVTAGNPINGREYSTAVFDSATPDDLQYACIFPLPEPRDCSLLDPAVAACDCFEGANDTPVCEEQPGQSAAGTLQYWGKAYPGTRQLEVLRGLGEQAVVASICAANTTDPEAADFSYRPAIAALVDSMEASLRAP